MVGFLTSVRTPWPDDPTVWIPGVGTPCERSQGTGEVPGARLYSRLMILDADLEPVPAILGDAARRVAHEVAVPEFVEDAEEGRPEIRGLLDLEQPAAGERREVAEKFRLGRRSHRHAVDDDVRAPGPVE